jgi:hypothetical protein
MSAKTTLLLGLLVALAAGGYWFLDRSEAPLDPNERRFFPGLRSEEVVSLSFEGGPADGLELRRDGAEFVVVRKGDGAKRRAKAEKIDALLRALTSGAWLKARPDATNDEGFALDASRRRAVVLKTADGESRRLDVGAVVRDGVLIARLDRRKTPVEIDAVVADDVFAEPDAWVDLRLLGLEAFDVGKMRVFDRADGGAAYVLFREGGRWHLSEPEFVRAEQSAADRLVALVCAAEATEIWNEPAPSAVALRATFERRIKAESRTIAFAAPKGATAAARVEPDGAWMRVSKEFFDLLAVDPRAFRTRRIADVDARFVSRVEIRPKGGPVETYVRGQDGFYFVAPEAFGWRTPGYLMRVETSPESRPVQPFPLDPSESTRLIEGLASIEATDVLDPPEAAFEPAALVVLEASVDGSGARAFKKEFGFGAEKDGRRRVRLPDGTFVSVRDADVAFLFRPFYSRFARFVGATLPHCVLEVDVVDAEGRKASLKAVGVEDGRFVFDKTSSVRPKETKRLSADATEAIRSKLATLTVSEFLGFGHKPEYGFDAPQFVVRFKDTVQTKESEPRLDVPGGYVEWRVGATRPGGGAFGTCDLWPGLVFSTDRKDLDPILDLLHH